MDSAHPTGAEKDPKTGTVAVAELGSLASGQSVAEALSSNGIPAAVEPLPSVRGETRALVVVAFEHHRDADRILRELSIDPIPRFDVGAAVQRDAPIALVPLEDEEEEPLLEPAHPDPGPLFGRISLVLLAIAFGIVADRAAEAWLGVRGPIQLFGASLAAQSEPWRFITAGFMHFGLGHALSNAVFALIFGVVLFGTHRPGAVALSWLLASAFGIWAEASVSAPLAWIAGASAGNYGLVGLWAKGQLDRAKVVPMPMRERVRTLGILLVLLPGALTPVTQAGAKVAVLAHAAGFSLGFLSGYLFRRRVREEDEAKIDRRARVGGIIAGLLVAFAFIAAVWSQSKG
ncbi:MAG: rhomboid family intramembrane serine protease [Myxococcota bacterium]